VTIEEKKQVKEFFQALFEGMEGYIEIRPIDCKKNPVKQYFYSITDINCLIADLASDGLSYFKDTNVYFGVCPRRERKGKEENVGQLNSLWIDLDCKTMKEKLKALKKLEHFEFPPSIIVSSGNGLHCYWLLSKPYPIRTNKEKLNAKGYVKGLTLALHGDSTFDLSRVLRVPGTKNLKNPDNPLPVEILEFNTSRRYELSKFEQYKVDVEEVRGEIEVIPDKIPDGFWRALEEKEKLRATWEGKRPDLKDQSRSAYDISLADLSASYGFSKDQIAAILTAAPYNEKKRLTRKYLSHTIAKAMRKKDRKVAVGKESKPTIPKQPPNLEKMLHTSTKKPKLEDDGSVEPHALEELLGKYWETTEQRDELALGIAAYLCKLDWPWAMVRSLLRAVGKTAKNEEMDERLRVLKTAYRKWQTGEPIAGSEKLRDILTASDLEKLEQLAKERRIPAEVRMIDKIRCQPRSGQNGKRPFIVDREVCEAVVRDLKEKGRFLQVEGGPCYWFNDAERKVMAIDSPMMETVLDVRYGINPADRLIRNVIASLRTETLTHGEDARVYRLAHYDVKNNILYVYAGGGLVYKLNGQKIETQNNGNEGVFFQDIEKEACWKADFNNPRDPFETLIKGLSFASGEGVVLSPHYQRSVLWLWLRSLFFEEIQPTKPILVLTGDHGSGKTTALRRILYLLSGPRGEVSSVKDEQAWTPAITSNYLVVLDNVDKKLKWLPDKLDLAATGQTIYIRVLYETNREYKVTPRCFLALTTVHPPFEESTVVDRFILLRMQPLDEYMSEKNIRRDVLSQRNRLWAGLLNQLNSDINYLQGKDIDVAFRMADWAELCSKLLRQEKNGSEIFSTIIEGLKKEQSAQVLDYSIVPQILNKWEGDGSGWYSTAELYEIWKATTDKENLTFFKSARGLGMHLSNIRRALRAVYGVNYRSNKRIWEYQFPGTWDKEE